jgi:hypothetical protein
VNVVTSDFKYVEDDEDQSCWISPEGKVTFAQGALHSTIAREVLGDETGGRDLERAGYVHVSWTSVYGGYSPERGVMEPTQAQLDALFDLSQHIQKYHPESRVAKKFLTYIEDSQRRAELL